MKADLLLPLLVVAFLAVLFHWMPLWRRRSLWFGVTVAPEFQTTPAARQILNGYRVGLWSASVAAACLSVAAVQSAKPWLLSIGVYAQTLAAMGGFALARRRVWPYAQPGPSVRTASLLASHEDLPGGVATVIGPFIILAATALYVGRSGAWKPLLIGAFLNGFMLVMAEAILRASPRARVADTVEWTARFRRANLKVLVAAMWGLSIMLSLHALKIYAWIGPILLLAAMLPFLWQLIRIVQEPGSGADGTPDECWKLGQFYYNPNDPALLVEKRFGVGYTFNFANRVSWLVMGLLLSIVLLTFVLGSKA